MWKPEHFQIDYIKQCLQDKGIDYKKTDSRKVLEKKLNGIEVVPRNEADLLKKYIAMLQQKPTKKVDVKKAENTSLAPAKSTPKASTQKSAKAITNPKDVKPSPKRTPKETAKNIKRSDTPDWLTPRDAADEPAPSDAALAKKMKVTPGQASPKGSTPKSNSKPLTKDDSQSPAVGKTAGKGSRALERIREKKRSSRDTHSSLDEAPLDLVCNQSLETDVENVIKSTKTKSIAAAKAKAHGADKPASEKAVADKGVTHKAVADKDTFDKAASKKKTIADKAASKKAATDKAATDKATAKKIAADKAATEKAVADKAAADKAAADKAAADKAASKKAVADKAASKKAAADKATAKKVAADKVAADKAAADKAASKKAAADKAASKKAAADNSDADKATADEAAATKAATDKTAALRKRSISDAPVPDAKRMKASEKEIPPANRSPAPVRKVDPAPPHILPTPPAATSTPSGRSFGLPYMSSPINDATLPFIVPLRCEGKPPGSFCAPQYSRTHQAMPRIITPPPIEIFTMKKSELDENAPAAHLANYMSSDD